MGTEFLVLQDETVLEIDGVDDSTLELVLNCTLKMVKMVTFMFCVFYYN